MLDAAAIGRQLGQAGQLHAAAGHLQLPCGPPTPACTAKMFCMKFSYELQVGFNRTDRIKRVTSQCLKTCCLLSLPVSNICERMQLVLPEMKSTYWITQHSNLLCCRLNSPQAQLSRISPDHLPDRCRMHNLPGRVPMSYQHRLPTLMFISRLPCRPGTPLPAWVCLPASSLCVHAVRALSLTQDVSVAANGITGLGSVFAAAMWLAIVGMICTTVAAVSEAMNFELHAQCL